MANWATVQRSLPLTELDASRLAGRHALCLAPSQRLDLTFGDQPNTISGINPVLTVEFKAGRLTGQYHFVTDQSCLNLFNENLTRVLRR